MTATYASAQPAGFSNTITKVAIVGATGTIGAHITAALLQTGKHSITALTRNTANTNLPAGVTLAVIDYSSPDTITAALANHTLLIITLAPNAPPTTHSILVRAAAAAGIRYIIPNSYGGDITNTSMGSDTLLGPVAAAQRAEIEELGMHWIAVCCGFWYDYSLAGGEARFGFDFDKRAVTLYDEGDMAIPTSTLAQIGRAVAAVLSLKEMPDDEADSSLTLASFVDKGLYLKSFVVSQKDMLESVKRVTGTTDADWTVTKESSKKRYEEGMAMVKKGNMAGFGKLLYARGFYPDTYHNLLDKTQNDILGLPEENLDDATQDAVNLVPILAARAERMAN
ncbi:hypothetical protein VHEMI02584 [[Torrubiella] hemipterigena]|uniref:NAD(P)-binding domain-containing protein n=1 Tax=[Torrubiella] hemipterigena TaxID=1531966 RepID=A0A0A1T8L5_9HYPO|nr:hypothetical protein VHEMI02584 [[Torrubiella] hemipterigena]